MTPGEHYEPFGSRGCTYEYLDRLCGSQDTVTVDGVLGRRCADHAPWIPADRGRPVTETIVAAALIPLWLAATIGCACWAIPLLLAHRMNRSTST